MIILKSLDSRRKRSGRRERGVWKRKGLKNRGTLRKRIMFI